MDVRLRVFLGTAFTCAGVALIFWVGAAGYAAAAHASNRPSGPPQFGTDARVNPTPSPGTKRDRNISMALDPANPQRVVAAYEYGDLNGVGSGYSVSTDAGQSWNGDWFLGPWGSQALVPNGNPVVAADGYGHFFYSTQVAAQSNSLNGYCVLTSINGVDWGTPVPVKVTSYNEYRDQGYLAVDARTSGQYAGSAYLIWRFFGENYEGAWLTYSRDGGATWSEQVEVSDAGNSYIYGPSLSVASNGWVYAAFSEFDLSCICNPPLLYIDRSTDGGQTWGNDRLISGAPAVAIGAPDPKFRELTLLGNGNQGSFRINHYPSFVVSPADPDSLYAVWNDGRWDTDFQYFGNTGKHSDIAFSRSTDGGQTWTQPSRLNDDPMGSGTDQWEPKIAVGPGGVLGVTWYDRRDDPAGYLYDLYYTQSTDGGLTWSPDQRVSDTPSDPMAVPDYKGVGDVGYHNSLVFGPDYVLPGWVDTRRGSAQDVYADKGVITFPSPSPTSTPTVRPTATSTPCTAGYTDIQPTDYFYTAVSYLSCAGAISGYADGTFRPYNNATRGQVSKIVTLAEGWTIDTTGGPHFSDVPPTNPFYSYVETAYGHGVISGYADGTFRWGSNVTRGQLTKIIVSALDWTIDTRGGPHFSDLPASDAFYGYIETAFNRGVISGYADGTFRPANNATRGQISKIIYNALTAP